MTTTNNTLQKRIETRAVGIGLEFRDAIASRGSNRDVAEAVATLTQTAANWMAEWLLEHLWISVDEALPDRGSVVFIRFDHGGYSVRMFTNYDRSFADTKGGKITHWMPIPELPKGGE